MHIRIGLQPFLFVAGLQNYSYIRVRNIYFFTELLLLHVLEQCHIADCGL